MTTQQSIDQAKTEAFVGKVLTDVTSAMATVMAVVPRNPQKRASRSRP